MPSRDGRSPEAAVPPESPVLVARILKPHGLSGAVRVELLSDVAGRFGVGAIFWLLGEPPARVTVAEVRGDPPGGVYLRFEEWSSVDEAVAARGRYLAIAEAERPTLPEGSYYHDQLKGLIAWTEGGERVGVVRDLWSTGPHDVLVLDADGAERLLAAVKSVVVEVDLAGGRIIVRPPNGWLDDDAL
jgi:16S rRNA processing protein RimM